MRRPMLTLTAVAVVGLSTLGAACDTESGLRLETRINGLGKLDCVDQGLLRVKGVSHLRHEVMESSGVLLQKRPSVHTWRGKAIGLHLEFAVELQRTPEMTNELLRMSYTRQDKAPEDVENARRVLLQLYEGLRRSCSGLPAPAALEETCLRVRCEPPDPSKTRAAP
jgi:hypothetical protein